MDALNNPDGDREIGPHEMSILGKLISKADAYDPLPHDEEALEARPDDYRKVWEEASNMRSDNSLLELGTKIQCQVVAIHGDYDPHLYEGVKQPLTRVLQNFRFILLKNCGHCPWFERNAKDEFYHVLKNELR